MSACLAFAPSPTHTLPENYRRRHLPHGPNHNSKSNPKPQLTNTNSDLNKYVGPPYSRTKTYAARMSRSSSSYRSMSAARAGPLQQTRRPPMLLSIDGTDRTDGRTRDRFMTLTAYYMRTA